MEYKRIYLSEESERVYLDTYVAADRTALRDAILVIPGGGYGMVCSDREGEPIALAFAARGLNAFVLHYRVGGEEDKYPAQLIDASRAVLYIKRNASMLGVDPDRIFAVGFSAGGHLAGSLAILHKEAEVLSLLGISEGENRPKAAVLGYPVVTALSDTHKGSFERLTGKSFEDIPEEERRRLSLEVNVDSDSAPLFIFHTAEDTVVPPLGSLRLAYAYAEKGLPLTMHLYPYGPHGIALANDVTECGEPAFVQPLADGWVDDAVSWFKTLK